MKAKMFAGLFLAAILGSCPIVADLASGSGGGHSCCRAAKPAKNQPSSKAAGGDCCLRVPAHAAAALATPEFHIVFILPAAASVLSPSRRLFSDEVSGSSPPGTAILDRSSSPRSPPVPA